MAIRWVVYGVGVVRREGLRAEKDALSCLKACDFRVKFETQLRSLLFREPIGHLREDRAVKQNASWLPRHLLRGSCFSQNLVQLGTDLIWVSAINRGRLIFKKIILFVAKEVALSR